MPVIDTYGRMDSGSIPFIRLDDQAIAEAAAEYFFEHNFKNYAFCGFPGLRFSEARGTAFRKAVEKSGNICDIYNGHSGKLKETFVRNERMDSCSDEVTLRKWVKALPKQALAF
jgi:DNA-binding LacI/PurR family transcriptional regulator